jgi:hypothetical protein
MQRSAVTFVPVQGRRSAAHRRGRPEQRDHRRLVVAGGLEQRKRFAVLPQTGQ